MRKSSLLISAALFTLIFLSAFIVSAQVFPQTPLKLCWQLENFSEGQPAFIFASDNESFFIASNDGSIQSVDARNGKTIWRSNLGGEFIDTFAYDDTKIFLLSESETGDKNSASVKEKENEYSVIALSKQTGIPKWQTLLSKKANENIFILNDGKELFLLSGSGNLTKLSLESGSVLLKNTLNKEIISVPYLSGQYIFTGTSDKKIIGISKTDGAAAIELQTDYLPSEILDKSGKNFFIADNLGNIASINGNTGKTEWKMKAGAQAANMTLVDRGLLISSRDNFVYLLSIKNGKRIWRKRLSGRSAGIPLISNGIAVFSTLNGNDAVFINNDKGKIVNQILIPDGDYFVGNNLWINGFLIFQTYRGLKAYGSCGEPEKK